MSVHCSQRVWKISNQKGSALLLPLAIANYEPTLLPSFLSPPSHPCFKIMSTPVVTIPFVLPPLLAYFNRNLPAKFPHVPPLFPNFFSHPTPPRAHASFHRNPCTNDKCAILKAGGSHGIIWRRPAGLGSLRSIDKGRAFAPRGQSQGKR